MNLTRTVATKKSNFHFLFSLQFPGLFPFISFYFSLHFNYMIFLYPCLSDVGILNKLSNTHTPLLIMADKSQYQLFVLFNFSIFCHLKISGEIGCSNNIGRVSCSSCTIPKFLNLEM